MNENELKKLQEAYALRCVENRQLHERVASLEEEITRLKELLRLQQERLFGKKSELTSRILNSKTPTTTPDANPTGADSSASPKTTTVVSHTRKIPPRGKRQFTTNELPIYTVIHDLPELEKNCSCCGKPMHVIAKEKSEALEIIPIQYCIVKHIRLKYGCRPCDSIVMAPKPAAPIPKAIAGPSLLVDVILNKYQYHLPLYRQSKIMHSNGVTISDKTLANWVLALGDGLLKIYEAMWIILQRRYLQVDETPVKVLKTNKKGYVWAYFAPNVGKGLVVFEFSLTREGSVAAKRLQQFKGLLQTDGYAGYNALRKRDDIVSFGCLSHARRKFSEVIKMSGDQQGIAAEMIERLKPLYALEAKLREAGATHRTRKRLRQKIARPILQEIYRWLRSIKHKVLPKSKLGQAISYTLNQWPYLIAYLRHGMAEIDTNYVENKIRDIALGKKNWLFMGNEACGKIHALWYTLIISAIINDLNPRVYIHYLLTKIHQLRRGEIDPLTLLPDRIDINELENFANEQIELARKMLNALHTEPINLD
jgi:transposase